MSINQVFLGVASAYEFPNALWNINDKYTAAVETKNSEQIITYGLEILSIMQNEPENSQVMELKASRLEQIALAYERMGDYQNSAEIYGRYIPYAEQFGWADAVKIAKAKIIQYEPQIEIYTESDEVQKYYNAKLEPQTGVLFGSVSDGGIREDINESMVLLYLEFGDTDLTWTEHILSEAQKKGIAVEFAWNMLGEGSQIPEVLNSTDYIVNVLKVLGKYNVPIYLRFAAEVNIWNNKADKTQFIEAFRHVSKLARQYSTNIAVVWSVNPVSSWDINMEDYYPGDEYVDWVGVSLYSQKYFLGRNDWPENEKFNEIVFLAGDNADPVIALNEVITKFGEKKPIMLAESGASHRVRTLNEDTTDWAKLHMQKLYYNIPMVYPQVKLIAHFDKVIENETNDYALSTSNELTKQYIELTNLPQYIKGADKSGSVFKKSDTYIELQNSIIDLYTYVHLYKSEVPKINYYIDDVWVYSSQEMPYKCSLDLGSYSPGEHTLSVSAESGGIAQFIKIYTVNVKENIRIVLNGNEIKTDVSPIIQNNRTLVPVRVITEALGAIVSWDESAGRVTIKRGSDTIIMQINNSVMTFNSKSQELDVPPQIIDSRTLVPVRAISEAFNLTVDWDSDTSTVILKS